MENLQLTSLSQELLPWQAKQEKVMLSFLEELNRETNRFVLKGGMAIRACYGLDRFSDDIDLEGYQGTRLTSFVVMFCEKRGYAYRLAKNTPTVERFLIDYGEVGHPLKVEVSYREKATVNGSVTKKRGITVYTADHLAGLKAKAYAGRDRLRDLYELTFLCKHHFQELSEETKGVVAAAYKKKGLEQLDYLLRSEDDPSLDKEKLAADFLEVNDMLGLLYSKEEKETLVLKEVSEKVSEGKKPSLRPKARLLDKDISLGR